MDYRRCRAGKGPPKEVVNLSGENTPTSGTLNRRRNTKHISLAIVQNISDTVSTVSQAVSQAVLVSAKVQIKKATPPRTALLGIRFLTTSLQIHGKKPVGKSCLFLGRLRIKKATLTKAGAFVHPRLQNLSATIRERYEEFDSLPEPVIEQQHLTTSSVYETFRPRKSER